MDLIKKAIENGDLEFAKEKIKAMEVKLSEEPSLYMQSSLKKQLSIVKTLYYSKIDLALKTTKESEVQNVNIFNNFEGSSENPIIRDIQSSLIQNIRCDNLLVEDCSFLTLKEIYCKGTINIRTVKNTSIAFNSSHIRLTDAHNILLEGYCKSGVYLQNCTEIEIVCIDKIGNKCDNVFDFSSPTEQKNYTIRKLI